MDIKEIGAAAVIVVGGVAYGVSSGGLRDALSSDVKHISKVAYEDRADYMQDIVLDFAENFQVYIVQTETYDYVGNSKFSALPSKATFVEDLVSEEAVPRKALKGIKAQMQQSDFCEQDEMTMFTEKGWAYYFTLRDDRGRSIFAISCTPDASSFNNSAVS